MHSTSHRCAAPHTGVQHLTQVWSTSHRCPVPPRCAAPVQFYTGKPSQDPSFAPKINKCLCTVLLKNTKAKEEKGFLRKEVKHATPPGYWPGSLAVEQCVCSCVTPLGYCPGLMAVEQHQIWKLIHWKSSTHELNYPSQIRNTEI